MMRSGLLLCFLMVGYVTADCYLHNPRGSNNRLNEKSANRNNGDRLFDSQNNNRGGYNVGDLTDDAFDEGSNANAAGTPFTPAFDAGQYSEMFYEGSEMTVEWTNQHGCGGNEADDAHKLNCNMVMQYTCNTKPGLDRAQSVALKNGRNTNTPDDANNLNDLLTQTGDNDNNRRGRHESEGWYYECERRNRNKGLFSADQKLQGDAAKYTRQNPNGNRRGLECPEERDYYPYWSPSPWIDMAYLTDATEDCTDTTPMSYNILGNSQNVKELGKCSYTSESVGENTAEEQLEPITPEECTEAGGKWDLFTHGVKAPYCGLSDWSRVNHLGNGRDGQALTYNWTLPKADDSAEGLGKNTAISATGMAKCVLRIRYNISTDDYDPRNTTAANNQNKKEGIVSPVQQNPTVDVGTVNTLQGLKLAINTNQFGRTFQDRSHVFYVKQRPANIPASQKIYNLNVRGKRGNIVQTFPAVEYDFIPNHLHIEQGDMVHMQWTGSNTHNNGNPAGDGQAGDAGEGTGGTDRHNVACMTAAEMNYPIPLDTEVPALKTACLNHNLELTAGEACWVPSTDSEDEPEFGSALKAIGWKDCSVYMATSGYFKSIAEANTAEDELNETLDNAPASLDGGILIKPKAGEYHYMGTRNNNFSNRSQKGFLKVHAAGEALPTYRGVRAGEERTM